MPTVDPTAYPIDADRYRHADLTWLDELDRLAVHSGEPHQRMGTRAVDEASWLLADEHRDAELALRRRLVADAPHEVFGALAGSEAAAQEAAESVRTWLAAHRPSALADRDPTVERGHPLVAAGLAVQEDLCIMERAGDRWRLTSGIVCFPTYWRLAEKLGGSVTEIHGPVPHYDTDLADRVPRFFDRLAPGRIVSRRNWGFAAHPLLFVPDLSVLAAPGAFDPDHVWLRSERQTLRRLPVSDAVLFTIRVQLAPLSALDRRPSLAGRLRDAVENWSPQLVASRGGRYGWVAEVTAWLDDVGPV